VIEQFTKSYLSPSTFVRRAYASLEHLSANEVRLRRGCKKLIEEILPIAAFLKHFEIPGRRVTCKHFSGNQNYDAQIKVKGPEVRSGFIKQMYYLEVTSAVSSYAHLEREALSRHGSVFGGGSIQVVGSKHKGTRNIFSRAVAQDQDAPVIEASQWIEECLKAKSNKRYRSPAYY
jgi:hypothetical protein